MGDSDLVVDCDFPGGNILVDAVNGNTISVRPDLRDTTIEWFYWYFRVRNCGGRSLQIHFPERNLLGGRGPATSKDRGATWQWLGEECMCDSYFDYSVPTDVDEVRFSMGMPYLQDNLATFLKRFAGFPSLRQAVLCTSRKGRPVEFLHLGCQANLADYRVVLTARHHACEMMASYVLEGVMEEALSGSETGHWLLSHAAFLVVPFVDKDGVEDGDQGKCRYPHDHNRDYEDALFPEVRALMRLVPEWSGGKLDFFLDLHCPSLQGSSDETIFLVGGPEEDLWQEVGRFSDLLELACHGPLPYRRNNNMPWGKEWNTSEDHEPGTKASSTWAGEFTGTRFASGIEIPYANAGGVEVNAETARAFGHDLSQAICLYLREEK